MHVTCMRVYTCYFVLSPTCLHVIGRYAKYVFIPYTDTLNMSPYHRTMRQNCLFGIGRYAKHVLMPWADAPNMSSCHRPIRRACPQVIGRSPNMSVCYALARQTCLHAHKFNKIHISCTHACTHVLRCSVPNLSSLS